MTVYPYLHTTYNITHREEATYDKTYSDNSLNVYICLMTALTTSRSHLWHCVVEKHAKIYHYACSTKETPFQGFIVNMMLML